MSGELRLQPPRTREEVIADDSLGEFHVWWADSEAGRVHDDQRITFDGDAGVVLIA